MTSPILLDIPLHIKTPRLTLTCPQAGDGKLLHEAMLQGYPELVQWLNFPETPPSAEALEIEARQLQAKFILREDIRYILRDTETQKVIGRCGFAPLQTDWHIPKFGLAYFISQPYRGHRIATEVAGALTRLAFQALNARKVEIKVDPDNPASLKIPEKLGFTLEAKQVGNWFRRDKPLADLWTFACFDPKTLPPLEMTW